MAATDIFPAQTFVSDLGKSIAERSGSSLGESNDENFGFEVGRRLGELSANENEDGKQEDRDGEP